MEKNNKKKAINVYLSENTIKALDIWKSATGLSRNQTISLAVSKYLLSKDEFKNNEKAKMLLESIDL